MSRHPFAFDSSYRAAALVFGITGRTAHVDIADDLLVVRFGPWRLRTPVANVADATVTGDYAFWRTAGPPHLSLTDHGVTFATNSRHGLCLSFVEPVRTLDPTGHLLHPAATVTVADPALLAREVLS